MSLEINAQGLIFENFTTKNGLISDDVYNLHQDKDGYVWIFTNYGTTKYNRKRFETTLKNLPFNESFVYCVFENKSGRKWIVNSNSKIYEVKSDSAFEIRINGVIPSNFNFIYQIYVDDSLNIYLNSNQSCYKILWDSRKLVKLNQQKESDTLGLKLIEHSDVIIPVMEQKPGTIWSINLSHYNYIRFDIMSSIKNSIFLISYEINHRIKYCKRFDQNIFVSTDNKLIKISESKKASILKFSGSILNFVKDKYDHLWVACYNDGLYELDENDSIVNHYFVNTTINDILFDSQNGLWVSTEGKGLHYCSDINRKEYDEPSLINTTIGILKVLNEKLFISNTKGDIYIIENQKLKKIIDRTKNLVEPLDIINHRGNYTVNYRQGLGIFDKNIKRLSTFSNSRYYSYKTTVIGKDSLFFTQRYGGIWVYNNKLVDIIRVKHKVYYSTVRNSKLLIATENGVYYLVNNKLERPSYLLGTEKCIVTKVVEDNFGNYWFCSKGAGVFKLSLENILTHYTYSEGLPTDIINDISFTLDNGVLLSTNKGLYISSGILNGWIRLLSEEVKSSILFEGNVYSATNRGLIVKDYEKRKRNDRINFNLSTIRVNGSLSNTRAIQALEHFQKNIEFDFDVISAPLNVSDIVYKLQGADAKTGVSENQKIIFQSLNPGCYTLTASLFSNKAKIIEIPFVIEAAFWQTGWFKFVCIILGLILSAFIGWVIFYFYRKRETKKNEINRLIIEYKLIALKAQINPHFMSNCLTAIQYLIVSNKFDEAIQYLAKFSFLVRKVLEFSSKEIVSVKEELHIIDLNIELEQLRFEKKVVYSVEFSEDVDITRILIPPLILQPIIENAIWHGLLPLKGWKKCLLSIKVTKVVDLLYLIIEDNGVGRSDMIKEIGNSQQSKGIEITRQRISNFNSLYHVSSGNIEYEDLIDEDNQPSGTRVKITLPLITQYE